MMATAIFAVLSTGSGFAAGLDFRRDVWPILEANCVECHGAKKQKSSLRVDSRAALLKGGDTAPAIVPGDAKSHLLEAVLSADESERMPLDRDPLTPEQIAVLRRWILEGAPWPDDAVMAPTSAKHWAYERVQRPALPAVSTLRTQRNEQVNPIDAFLIAKLAERGLRFSGEAEPHAFVRRATLDLTGLPPTPEEIAAFERDCAAARPSGGPTLPPAAVARLIERLLASPRHGERWAQHWLDVIRYADTSGYEANSIRPNAWPYRDYVIAAFNQDVPYSRFIFEQLAGDTVGADPATGFLVTPPFPSRIEVGQEATAIAQARFNGLDEVVQNISSALLGATVSCARCHDHKFDPISARDYYQLAANFAGLEFLDRPWKGADRPLRLQQDAEREIARLRAELASFPAAREGYPTAGIDRFLPVRAKFVRLGVMEAFSKKTAPAFDEIEIWTAGTEGMPPRNVASAKRGAIVRTSGGSLALKSRDDVLNDGLDGVASRWVAECRVEDGKRLGKDQVWVEIELPETAMIDRVGWRLDYFDQGADTMPQQWRLATDWTIEVAEQPGQWRTVVSDERADGLAKADQDRRRRLEKEFATATTRLREATRVFAGGFRAKPGPLHVLSRGDPQQPREPVAAGGIDVMGRHAAPIDVPDVERRTRLARWIASEQHPLTARVIVNRVWRHHFGAGIVDTPADFGTQGERPSHPELLDWLASEFMARGWRLKELHRLICTSAAYGQSSRPDRAALAIDADSRLLWRFPPRRLEAEAIRDSILAVSGSLDLAMGGPGINLYQPRPKLEHGEWLPAENPGPETWRRAIYLLRMRGADDGVFKPFDVPNSGQVCAKRTVSTTPLQALNLFNSPFVHEQAARLAARVQREGGTDLGSQLDRLFRLTLGRAPSARERKWCGDLARQHNFAAVARALLNSNEFLFVE